MLSKPKYGWTKFTLGDFDCEPSDSTEVPLDLLNCMQQWATTGTGSCFLDCEGCGEYVAVFSPLGVHIIHYDRGTEVTFESRENLQYRLIQELITDIERDMEDWKWWGLDCKDQQGADDYEQQLRMEIAALRAYLPLEYQITKES